MTIKSDPQKKPCLIAIGGPTAAGKTEVGIALAQRLKGEVISADSRQFYKEMTIGTAKPTEREMDGVKHHFIDSLHITHHISAGEFSRQATSVALDIFARGHLPIAVGGSGLYLRALTDGLDDLPGDESLRLELQKIHREKGLKALHRRLEKKDPEAGANIDMENPVRVMRVIELVELTGQNLAEVRSWQRPEPPFHSIKIGLKRDRAKLYEAINMRVDRMIGQGLEAEARKLLPYREHQAMQTVGYREWFPYFDGDYDRDEAIRLIKRNTRRYAKRQMTWFGRDADVMWFDAEDRNGILAHVESRLAEV